MRIITVLFLLFTLTLSSQNKKPVAKTKAPESDSAAAAIKVVEADTTDPVEESLKANRKFGVYTRKPRKDKKMKLCINLVSPTAMYNFCVTDSACKYPEKSKILFEKTEGDSTFVLVFAEAFTKVNDKPQCDDGKETKLFFVRWNTATNKAIWKQRTVSSCIKVITNMTKDPIIDWDGSAPLVVNYHKGGNNFIELKFDPENYKLGFQSSAAAE